jgi:hypothetical protein
MAEMESSSRDGGDACRPRTAADRKERSSKLELMGLVMRSTCASNSVGNVIQRNSSGWHVKAVHRVTRSLL